jgi:hypothetical protein
LIAFYDVFVDRGNACRLRGEPKYDLFLSFVSGHSDTHLLTPHPTYSKPQGWRATFIFGNACACGWMGERAGVGGDIHRAKCQRRVLLTPWNGGCYLL